jgi:hypothetical protein
MVILSISFIYAGKIESVIFDKQKQLISLCNTSVICRKEERNFKMQDISDVKAYKKGHNGVNVYTLHFKIMIEFRNMAPLKVWETQSGTKAKKQVRL